MKLKFFYGAACAVAMLGLSASANAQLTGTAYLNTAPAGSGLNTAATLANFNTAAQAGNNIGSYTFNLLGTNLTFNSGNPNVTGAQFLATGGAILTSGASAAAQTMSGGNGGNAWDTYIDIHGVFSSNVNQSITITHDDGIAVYVQGVLLTPGSAQGPTSSSPTTFTLTATAGQTFDLIYNECCSGPAVLTGLLPNAFNPVPEPASIAFAATALIGAGIAFRRRRLSA
jgi:PEP-CTERM motif